MRTRRSIYKSPANVDSKENTPKTPRTKAKKGSPKKSLLKEATKAKAIDFDAHDNSDEVVEDIKEVLEPDEQNTFVISTNPSQDPVNDGSGKSDSELEEAPEKSNETDEEDTKNQSYSSDEETEKEVPTTKADSDDSEPEDLKDEGDMFYISAKPSDAPEVVEEDEEEAEDKPSSKKRKREKKAEGRKYPKYNESTERSLEKFLFGKSSSQAKPLEDSSSSSDEEEASGLQQWQVLKKADASSSSSSSDEDDDDLDDKIKALSSSKPTKKRKPAWHDEEDDNVLVKDVTATYTKAIGKHGKKETSTENYAKSLRKQFTALTDTPKWADLEMQKAIEDSDDEFFRETTDMLASGKRDTLKKGFLEYRKLKDMNCTTHNEGTVIRCSEFHPSAAVGLVAGLNGTASLFQIDGKMNPKMQSVHFENFPIKTAHFSSDGRQFLAGSQHFGHFFAYDMIKGQTIRVPWKQDQSEHGSMQRFEVSPVNDLVAFHGRFGTIHLMSARSRTKLFSLKMNDDLAALTFSPDGEYLYSHGVGGEVYIWDLKNQECVHKFVDDGCVKGTAISVSRNNRYLSCGSNSGVVNVYNRRDCWTSFNPVPEKIVLNLTTTVSSVKFNPTSEILAMASEVKDNAVKLLHLPSMTVFSNFPSFNFNVKRPNCIDFSLNGGYLSIGNNRGAANLYRLKHFGNY